jgi:hypothetical protein
MKGKRCLLQMLPLWLLAPTFVMGDVTTGTDADAGLPFWEWRSPDMSLRLVQRLPDQSRAFFMARGFPKMQAERIAQSCVFQTVYKNTARPPADTIIEYDLSEWRIHHEGKSKPLKLRQDWKQLWDSKQLPLPVKLAFEWSLLPTRQRYQASDFNWGMTTYNIPPGSVFDLTIVWYRNGERQQGVIPAIECAPDVHVEPS